MPNGVAVRLPPELEPPSALAPTATSSSATEGIEASIGEATASAATALARALEEYQNGGLTSATRMAGGERIARLYELQQSTKLDFVATAREQGKIALRRYLDADDFYRRHGPGAGEATLDVFIDGVLAIVDKVTAFERARAN